MSLLMRHHSKKIGRYALYVVLAFLVIPILLYLGFLGFIKLEGYGIGYTYSNLEFVPVDIGDTIKDTKFKRTTAPCSAQPEKTCEYISDLEGQIVRVENSSLVVSGEISVATIEVKNKKYLIIERLYAYEGGSIDTDDFNYTFLEISADGTQLSRAKLQTSRGFYDGTDLYSFTARNRLISNSEGFILGDSTIQGFFTYVFRGLIPANVKVI